MRHRFGGLLAALVISMSFPVGAAAAPGIACQDAVWTPRLLENDRDGQAPRTWGARADIDPGTRQRCTTADTPTPDNGFNLGVVVKGMAGQQGWFQVGFLQCVGGTIPALCDGNTHMYIEYGNCNGGSFGYQILWTPGAADREKKWRYTLSDAGNQWIATVTDPITGVVKGTSASVAYSSPEISCWAGMNNTGPAWQGETADDGDAVGTSSIPSKFSNVGYTVVQGGNFVSPNLTNPCDIVQNDPGGLTGMCTVITGNSFNVFSQ